ncbi:hypothetical protein T458_10675 [Brevibacillus panacihumi W25]|uniref:Uncharacterized protein n=1 Tax=Brevibacillus panacihumi W25 TaxID=1408254 RepID=V6MI63_9BACL|nr:hypothetical protein T458_10675 [Brevibacillus panacihumi W25]
MNLIGLSTVFFCTPNSMDVNIFHENEKFRFFKQYGVLKESRQRNLLAAKYKKDWCNSNREV